MFTAPECSNTFQPWSSRPEGNSHIPRWLFRSWSPGSNGLNSSSVFISPAKQNGRQALSWDSLGRGTRRASTRQHVQWHNAQDDILISFSSSLIFALQHGIFKIANPKDPADTSRNGFLTIIDTRGIESAFMPMLTLMKECNLDERTHPQLAHDWFTHEFVAQDFLVHVEHSVSFSFQQMADAGLFRAFKDFQDEASFSKLAVRWIDLTYGPWHFSPWIMTDKEKAAIQCLSKDLIPSWRFAVAINILAMKARPSHDQRLYGFLQKLFLEAGEDKYQDILDPDRVLGVDTKTVYKIMRVLLVMQGGSGARRRLLYMEAQDLAPTVEEALGRLIKSAGYTWTAKGPTGGSALSSMPAHVSLRNEPTSQVDGNT